jgi:hypothetical protein
MSKPLPAGDTRIAAIGALLADMTMFPLQCHATGSVQSRDSKHVMKRQRTAAQRPNGIKVCNIAFSPAAQRDYLLELALLTQEAVNEIFMKEKDAMNVPAAYNYISAMAKVKNSPRRVSLMTSCSEKG